MRKLFLLFVLAILTIPLVFARASYASTTATVAATVTVQNISVSVTDGTIDYGVLAVNSSAGTNGSDTQAAQNDGNVAEDFNIKGQNSANWTLDTANSTTDHYIHRFCASSCASPPTSYTALTTNYQSLASNVSASGSQNVDLYITTPQTSSVFTQQSVDVTVQAVIH
jgi:hypothetical protein